jgi:hypothetical protein
MHASRTAVRVAVVSRWCLRVAVYCAAAAAGLSGLSLVYLAGWAITGHPASIDLARHWAGTTLLYGAGAWIARRLVALPDRISLS